MPSARFDDLRAGTALAFPRIDRELVATRADDVPAVLDEVDRATAAGAWAVGFVAYEAAAGLDPSLAVHEPVDGLPLAWFGLCAGPVPVPVVVPVVGPDAVRAYRAGPWSCEWGPDRHRAGVAAVRERIAAGETYQCNLTTRLTAPVSGELAQIYADLALGQRGAYNAYLDLGRFVIASASPELFFEWSGGGVPGDGVLGAGASGDAVSGDRVLMRPMKGTAPRGRTVAEDAAAVARLVGSEKERAENLMIVDLVRNDLARLARTGSVTVPALFRAERFETVHQLTSDVAAELLPGVGLTDVFRAPKPRTMALIRELEDGPRGVYCGAVGVVAPLGAPFRARFSVAIRTVLADRVSGTAVYGSGGGVTWGSEPAAEYAELLTKARVLDARPEEFHLIETMRHEAGRGVRSLDAHLRRMAGSAEYFGFRFDPAAARTAVIDRVTGSADARVRLLCFPGGELSVEVGPLPEPADRPLRLVVDDDPIDSRACWPQHKTSYRGPYTGRRASHPEADEVVLVNERGEVTEACTANLAVRLDGRWWTPPAGSGCLPGIERARLIGTGELAERVLRPADLRRAGGLALVNALRGWRPAVLDEAGRLADPRELLGTA